MSSPFRLNRNASSAQGLVGLWGPGGPSGMTLFDHSGRRNDGTLTSMDQATDWILDPERGWVLDFDGTDDFVDLNQSTILQPATSLSVCAWVRRDGAQPDYSAIYKSPMDGTASGHFVTLMGTVVARFYIRSAGWKSLDSDAAIPDGVNTHIACTWDGALMRMWVDSKLQAGTTAVASIDYGTIDENAQIGKYSDREIDGEISDVRVYNRALSSAEIQHIYQSTLREPYGDLLLRPRRVFKAATPAGVAPTSHLYGPLVGPLGGAV